MQILTNGLVSGLGIAGLAVAFQMVYLPTRVFFVGLAGIYCLAPFLAQAALAAGWGWPPAILLSVFGCVGVGVLCEFGNHARLTRRQASAEAHLVASLGTYIIIVQSVAMIWGNDPQTLRTGLDAVTRVGEVVVTGAQWITVGAAGLMLTGLGLFLMHTDLGLRLRALADNPFQFSLYGYNVDHHRLLAFALAGLFAAASSLSSAYDVGFDANTGLHPVMLAVAAVVIGGRASFLGPAVGGMVLGVLRAETVWYSSARWQEAVTFGLLALALLLRPEGLLGRRNRLEAAL
jgi:branched-chain amino acid transport system permease protein